MRVLFVTSEVHPLAKTGGLADVSEALPRALGRLGHDIRLLMPGYPEAKKALERTGRPIAAGSVFGTSIQLIPGRIPGSGLPIWLVDCPTLFERPGRLYCDQDGQEWSDNAIRFGLFSKVAAQIASGQSGLAWQPDVVHANDWHTGLIPAYLKASPTGRRVPTVFTIHNMAFQGNYAGGVVHDLELPGGWFVPDGLEFYGQVSFMKAGLQYADLLTTVSPTYAQEILNTDLGFGHQDTLRRRSADLTGILNGADYDVWNPEIDPHLGARYSATELGNKKFSKLALIEELGLSADAATPIVAFMSRITDQKMADIVLDVAPRLVAAGACFALLAEGDSGLEHGFRDLAAAHPGRVAVRIGYREPAAHRLLAGADILLAPARYEPCGLTQIYALRYGTIPVVRRTGGLADSVLNVAAEIGPSTNATGFAFDEVSADALEAAALRAMEAHAQPVAWRRLQLNAMKADFSWTRSAARYHDLYRSLHEESQPELELNAQDAAAVSRPRQMAS